MLCYISYFFMLFEVMIHYVSISAENVKQLLNQSSFIIAG